MAYTHEAKFIVIRGQGEPSPTTHDDWDSAVAAAEAWASNSEAGYPDGLILTGTRVRYTA